MITLAFILSGCGETNTGTVDGPILDHSRYRQSSTIATGSSGSGDPRTTTTGRSL